MYFPSNLVKKDLIKDLRATDIRYEKFNSERPAHNTPMPELDSNEDYVRCEMSYLFPSII